MFETAQVLTLVPGYYAFSGETVHIGKTTFRRLIGNGQISKVSNFKDTLGRNLMPADMLMLSMTLLAGMATIFVETEQMTIFPRVST